MKAFKERVERKYQLISDGQKIAHMVPNYVVGKTYYLKGYFDAVQVKILEFKAPDVLIVDCPKPLEESCTLYHVFNKYMDLNCLVDSEISQDRYKLSVVSIRIATNDRKHPRADVPPDIAVINNIRAAKNVINASLFNIPTSVKVHFGQYQQQLVNLADEVKVQVFDKTNEKLDLVKKSSKVLLVSDTQDIMSYMPEDTNGFIDFREHLNTEVGRVMEEYRQKKIISELIVPIIYVGHDGTGIPLGYIHLVSKSKKIGLETALELKALSFEMVDRIRDSNTMMINKRQAIVNASKGGLRILVTDEELKKFLIHQKGFSFDVVFKLQQPITMFTEIAYTGFNTKNDLAIGVRIKGFSSRKGEVERFYGYIDNLFK